MSDVTQADREAAEEFYPLHLWKQAARDDAAQAFAAHRLASTAPLHAEIAELKRQVAEAARLLKGYHEQAYGVPWHGDIARETRAFLDAAAIRAAQPKETSDG